MADYYNPGSTETQKLMQIQKHQKILSLTVHFMNAETVGVELIHSIDIL